ncbi:hypothetical protein [Sporosarcina sp. G11-34]|uniref:hypothetical protein n=1 Tax=Sporosarcina sp. G11-34 TaxID=2849605 RepID=UPI0022A968F7|nr:hypothetical protein [Sporosarcina sp. G11-34]MCZ2260322.1 hypothetical protein [Sporosarcina sp. G11-34]
MNFTLFTLLIVLVSVFLFLRISKSNEMMKSSTKKFAVRINKSTHFKILLGFLGLLLILTAIGEFVYDGKSSADPAPKADADYMQLLDSMDSIDNQIINSEEVDPTLLVEKRTHSTGETLTIYSQEKYVDHFEGPVVYIERKSGNDKTIEEFIYKPLLVTDGYDFTQKVPIWMPIWEGDIMTLPKSPGYDITYTIFQEATALDQLTKFKSNSYQGYDSTYRPSVIHLKIPENLKIINEYEEEQLIYIDELD